MVAPALVRAADEPSPCPGGAPVVRVRGLSKRYGRTHALRGVSFDVFPGEVFGLIGADGVGKSSVIRTLAGTLSYDEGRVEVFGVSIDSERAAERVKGRLGFMSQGLGQNLYPELSVEENIDFFARIRLVRSDGLAARTAKLLEMTRLASFRDRPVKHLSGGMKQKLGLVCTLIHEPDLVLLDEPTTGVDPVSRQDFWELLTHLVRERRIAALVSTSYLSEAGAMDRLGLMEAGRILAVGREDDLLKLSPGAVCSAAAAEADRMAAALGVPEEEFDREGGRARVFVRGEDVGAVVARLRAAVGPEASFAVEPPALEDAVVDLLKRGRPEPVAASLLLTAQKETSPRREGAPVAIQACGLVRDFGPFRAVNGVSFEVRSGEVFGLLGANGAGKTTVIKMLIGLLAPSSGSGEVGGADIRFAGRDIRERLGYVSQAFSLYLDLTAEENIRLYAGIYGIGGRQGRERLKWIASLTELEVHRSAITRSLPVGVRQRLALGCALVHRPHVLFLDEPTSGVDVLGRRRFWRILRRLARDEGVAMLVTTHNMSEAEHCDRLALMHAGSFVAQGSPAELKLEGERDAGTPVSAGSRDVLAAFDELAALGMAPSLHGSRLRVFTRQPGTDIARITAALRARELLIDEPREEPFTLDDLFVLRIRGLEADRAPAGVGL